MGCGDSTNIPAFLICARSVPVIVAFVPVVATQPVRSAPTKKRDGALRASNQKQWDLAIETPYAKRRLYGFD